MRLPVICTEAELYLCDRYSPTTTKKPATRSKNKVYRLILQYKKLKHRFSCIWDASESRFVVVKNFFWQVDENTAVGIFYILKEILGGEVEVNACSNRFLTIGFFCGAAIPGWPSDVQFSAVKIEFSEGPFRWRTSRCSWTRPMDFQNPALLHNLRCG
jgi:hypothetical protein